MNNKGKSLRLFPLLCFVRCAVGLNPVPERPYDAVPVCPGRRLPGTAPDCRMLFRAEENCCRRFPDVSEPCSVFFVDARFG